MTKEEVKRIIDEALETDVVVDVIDAPEAFVYTQVWYITMEQLDTIRAKGVNILTMAVEGYHLTLRIKL